MKVNLHILLIFSFLTVALSANGQADVESDRSTIDVVMLKDGSKLRGTILAWDLDKGMDFKLLTGASIFINKDDINRVEQESEYDQHDWRRDRPYHFREKGWYQNSSGFLNMSFFGGAGIHHVMGYRFNRMLGVGLGMGIESNDLQRSRNIVPVYAEVRGFFLPKKITPYYAVKLGYGFALANQFIGTAEAKGGLHFSPEIGIRFGGGDVSYYLGVEWKLQNATFTDNDWWGGGGGVFTETVSYRRIELRTGLLF